VRNWASSPLSHLRESGPHSEFLSEGMRGKRPRYYLQNYLQNFHIFLGRGSPGAEDWTTPGSADLRASGRREVSATNSARAIRMLGRGNANECAEVRAGRLAQAAHAICLWLSGLRATQGMLPLLAHEVRPCLIYGEFSEVGRRAVSSL
jgi:hypothetical protein